MPGVRVPEEKIALFTDASKSVTYGSLFKQSLCLRDHMLRTGVEFNAGNESHSSSTLSAASTFDVAVRFSCQPRVAVLSEASENFVIALFAAWQCGAIVIPLCQTHPLDELEYVLRDSTVSLVLCSRRHSDLARRLSSELAIPHLCVEDCTSSAPLQSNKPICPKVECWNQRAALIVYTSGTTGRPKGVLSTHTNLR